MKCGTTLIPAMLAALLPLLRAEPVQVALLPAKIVPEQATTLNMDEGIISHLADATRHQPAGAIIAVLNEERTAQEREELELKLPRGADGSVFKGGKILLDNGKELYAADGRLHLAGFAAAAVLLEA